MDGSSEDVPRLERSNVPKVGTLEEMGAFWDEHDFTEFDTDAPDVIFDINPKLRIMSEERGEK